MMEGDTIKMKKLLLAIIMALVMLLSSGITTYAGPITGVVRPFSFTMPYSVNSQEVSSTVHDTTYCNASFLNMSQ